MTDQPRPPQRFLDRAEILARQDLITEDLFVPEWDAWVRVRMLTGAERDYFEASLIRRSSDGRTVTQNLQNIRARLCALCLVDDQGQRIFAEEDEYALGKKAGAALDRIFTVAQRLNGLRAEDVQDLAKNSAASLDAASPTV